MAFRVSRLSFSSSVRVTVKDVTDFWKAGGNVAQLVAGPMR